MGSTWVLQPAVMLYAIHANSGKSVLVIGAGSFWKVFLFLKIKKRGKAGGSFWNPRVTEAKVTRCYALCFYRLILLLRITRLMLFNDSDLLILRLNSILQQWLMF